MKNKITLFLIMILFISNAAACAPKPKKLDKYQADFMGPFDTFTTIIGYSKKEKQFNDQCKVIYDKLDYLHKRFDIYNDYDGINNLKTVNDNAGIKPIVVDDAVIDMLKKAKDFYAQTNGEVNVAMGAVLSIWHEYRSNGKNNPDTAELPPMELLQEAAKNTDVDNLIIDEQAKTIFLKNKGMSLDVGAVAKGYAADVAAKEAQKAGMDSALVNVGGNVISIGKPMDGVRDRWGIGVQNPKEEVNGVENIIDTIYVNDSAIVSSGNYQRYYIVDEKIYNHIIDKNTLMPASRYDSVTIVHKSSEIADALSTAAFLMTIEEAEIALNKYGAEAIWVFHDGSVEATEGFKAISKNLGNYSAVDK